jgi:hypothetical protein
LFFSCPLETMIRAWVVLNGFVLIPRSRSSAWFMNCTVAGTACTVSFVSRAVAPVAPLAPPETSASAERKTAAAAGARCPRLAHESSLRSTRSAFFGAALTFHLAAGAEVLLRPPGDDDREPVTLELIGPDATTVPAPFNTK